jgi:fumarate reductase flavoprotein subunit
MAAGISREMPATLDAEADVVIVGAGACGLVAALRAADAGASVIVLERDATPSGSTAMSSGFIPAPGTRFQAAIGVEDDTPERLVGDLMAKTKGKAVPHLAALAAREVGPALEWLADRHGLEWIVLDDFLYPGHTRHRMHAVPEKTGAALMARLIAATEAAGIPIVTEAFVETLHLDGEGRCGAITAVRPDGRRETVACKALVIASSGFAGNAALVARHIPAMATGLYFGHAGNDGSAIAWGEALGARVEHLTGYQGHGSVAHPHGILVTWALMMRGGVQVNLAGRRFSDESGGYSEQAVAVLAQPDGIAFDLYDGAIHAFALGFPDYRDAVAAGAVKQADDIEGLALATGLPSDALAETLAAVNRVRRGDGGDPVDHEMVAPVDRQAVDPVDRKTVDLFGRDVSGLPPLEPPFFAIRVTGALFHTQGGLMIDDTARVVGADGRSFANLFAGGGAACGVSGPDVSGYLSGNGLLAAFAFGSVAGRSAARAALGG